MLIVPCVKVALVISFANSFAGGDIIYSGSNVRGRRRFVDKVDIVEHGRAFARRGRRDGMWGRSYPKHEQHGLQSAYLEAAEIRPNQCHRNTQ